MSEAYETDTAPRRSPAAGGVVPRAVRAVGLFVAAILPFVSTACGNGPSEPDDGSDPVLPDLLGEWAWVCSTGGIGGETVCASTSGITASWEFRGDSVFRWLRNDTLVLSGPFRVVREPAAVAGDSLNRLLVNGTASIWTLEMPDRDHLDVFETCADCYSSAWTRVR